VRSVRLIAAGFALATVAATAACGGADTKAACDSIQAEIQHVSSTAMQQISDPQAMGKTYSDGAAKIREEGKKAGGDVESAANDIATAMETLGSHVAAGSTQQPDTAPLTNAGAKLKEACS
jgi:hypothetical protein